MTIEHGEIILPDKSSETPRSSGYKDAIAIIESGLEASRQGGYAELQVEGKSLGRWLATNLFRRGLEIEDIRDIIDRYIPTQDTLHYVSEEVKADDDSKKVFVDYKSAAANDPLDTKR